MTTDKHIGAELLAPSNRGKNNKKHGTRQHTNVNKRGHTRKSEAWQKALKMHTAHANRIDRAESQRAERRRKRAERLAMRAAS